jgi:TRAP-type C4-dicarboxylate transport system permease small subunit
MADNQPTILTRLQRATAVFEDALLIALLSAMILVAGTQIVLRNLFDSAILWADPLLRVAVLWVGMIGAMVATRSDKQIAIDALSRFLPQHWRFRFRVATDLFTAAVSAVVAWSAFRLMMGDREAGGMAISFVPVWVCESILPVAFAVIALRYLLFAVEHLRQSGASEEPL